MSIPFNTKQFEQKPNRLMPKTRVRLDNVIATQRALDQTKVQDIARQPSSAISTDPLVARHRGKYYLLDGHHRVAGALERGDTHITVRRVK